MIARGLGSLLGLMLMLTLAPARAAAPPELLVPASAAQPALALALGPDGLWLRACATAPCEARGGRRVELPAAALAAAAAGSLQALALDAEHRVALVRIPLSAEGAWEAIIGASAGQAEPVVAFAGFTGLLQGEDGQRSGDVVWVRDDEKGQRVLVGRAREDVQLCGRATMLEPRLLDKDLSLRSVKVQQLPLDERRAAPVLPAVRSEHGPTPGGNALRALAASSALGDPGALTDGRDASTWAEARGGDGRGEFVVLRPLSGVNLVGLELLVRPSGEVSALGSAPKALWVATRSALFRVEWHEDAWKAPGIWYRVELPAPVQADCLALVLEQGYVERTDTQVTLAEVRGIGDLQLLDPAALVARLSTPGEAGAAVVPALLQSGEAGIGAVLGAFDALDATGRGRALDVLENAPCERTAPALANLLDDADAQNRRRAEQRLRACGPLAEPALRRAFESAADESGALLARELALVDPALAAELLGPRLAAAPAEQRPGYRDALTRAARDPAAEPGLRRLLATPALGTAAELEVLRALAEQLPGLEPQASAALARAIGAARSFDQRYLLLTPASRLAPTVAAAADFIDAALRDPDPYLRGAAARVAPALPRIAPALVAASRDPAVRVREAAAVRLGELGLADASPALIERVRGDEWPLVRGAAARSLGSLGPSAGADGALTAAVRDASPDVRSAALQALGQRGARSALPAIAERLQANDEVAAVRAAAARALAELCDTSQLETLTRAARALLADRPSPDDVTVGGAALAALGRIAPADLEQRLAPFASAKPRPGVEHMVELARRNERRCVASPSTSRAP
jgi:HEAT repeat protein